MAHQVLKSVSSVVRMICGEAGLVIRLHLLFGGVRSVTTALKVVEEVQQELQEIEGERERRRGSWMEWRAQSRGATLTTCMEDMRDAHNLGLSHDVVCRS